MNRQNDLAHDIHEEIKSSKTRNRNGFKSNFEKAPTVNTRATGLSTANKEVSLAIQPTFNELIATEKRIINTIIDIEDLPQEERNYQKFLSGCPSWLKNLFSAHSVDEAIRQHNQKYENRKTPIKS